ncbi:MAG: MarR family winged helix-turn-helix transcriptional regulator [Candidatus Limnocylindria bacterium]
MTTDGKVDVATRLRAAIARVDRLLARQVVGSGLTRTQFSILGAVTRSGPRGLGDLAEREGINPTMLSRIVGKLETAGLLRRSPHPQDGRAVVVGVTDAGAKLYQQLQRERTGLIEDYLAELPPEQARRLVEALPVLENLADHLRQRQAAACVSTARKSS